MKLHALLLFGFVGIVLTVSATCRDLVLDEANAQFSLNPHAEFPGARASVTREESGWTIDYDFSGGGHGVGLKVKPKTPLLADRLVFEACHGAGHDMAMVVEDSTGQFHLKLADSRPFRWYRYECRLDVQSPIHWGGPNDGVIRPPVVSFEVNVNRTAKGTPIADDVGKVRIGKIAAMVRDAEKAIGDVRYLVSDFTQGDRYAGAPRLFFRDDTYGAVENGEIEVDLAAREKVVLYHEIPVWGDPKSFHLSVEASADAAGLSFEVGYQAGGAVQSVKLGSLAATAGTSAIRADLRGNAPKSFVRSKRVRSLVIRRGTAPAKKVKIRLLKLEAVVSVKDDPVPLLATPPVGGEAPRELEVAYLNLRPEPMEGGTVLVRATDWQGRELGLATADLPRTEPGGRSVVHVALPPVPAGVNFVSYACSFLRNHVRDVHVAESTTSWTRPLPDAGSAEKRPDLPWGFDVYLYRTEDWRAYPSGYASVDGEQAFARMEQKARLAQAMGVKWERAEFLPHKICREKGKFDFAFYDRLVDCADRHGISLHAAFSHFWPMRGNRRSDQNDLTAYTPETYTNWVETLRRAVERYRGRIVGWELWNEPNAASFWRGPKSDYSKLVSLAYPAVKAADPLAHVLAFSTTGIDLEFIDARIREGARFDGITIHPYRNNPDERVFISELAAVTNRSHGTKTRLTELGWPTGCAAKSYSEREQAAYFVRAYLAAAGSGCCAAIYGYDFFDDGFNVLERENNFGIVRRDGTPKPAYRALAKTFRFFTSGKPLISSRRASDGTDVWIFRMGGRSAVWSDRNRSLRVKTALRATSFNLMDEPIGVGEVQIVHTGPLDVVFFDGDVVALDELAVDDDRDGSATCEF